MFERAIQNELKKWVSSSPRKPLVIRGARQVGKTTVVNQFAAQFKQYIYLNLELPEDRRPFEQFQNLEIHRRNTSEIRSVHFCEISTFISKSNTTDFLHRLKNTSCGLQRKSSI